MISTVFSQTYTFDETAHQAYESQVVAQAKSQGPAAWQDLKANKKYEKHFERGPNNTPDQQTARHAAIEANEQSLIQANGTSTYQAWQAHESFVAQEQANALAQGQTAYFQYLQEEAWHAFGKKLGGRARAAHQTYEANELAEAQAQGPAAVAALQADDQYEKTEDDILKANHAFGKHKWDDAYQFHTDYEAYEAQIAQSQGQNAYNQFLANEAYEDAKHAQETGGFHRNGSYGGIGGIIPPGGAYSSSSFVSVSLLGAVLVAYL